MDLYEIILLLISFQAASVLSTPIPSNAHLHRRGFSNTLERIALSTEGFLYLGKGIIQEALLLDNAIGAVRDGKIDPVSTVEDALASLANIPTAKNHTTLDLAVEVLTAGLAPATILDLAEGLLTQDINSIANENPHPPRTPIYPKKQPHDAPYSLPEEDLRAAIYIPEHFAYAADGKRPVLLVPGTTDPAGSTYYFSYEKLLSNTDFADPVWVNIPGDSLGDIQVNAEYVAYAINYIHGISNETDGKDGIGVISWSQGGIDVQWALKYWPSTRESVADFMPLSADFHGSLFEFPCLSPSPLCTPALRQQGYQSDLIHALRGEDGDSAFVPTTSVYSGLDEIVQPQSDPGASGALEDVRGVGVTNAQIQLVCPGRPAGSFYLHETMLVNPLAYALFVDALMHDGPGDLARVDLETVCDQLLPPGLGLDDLLGTEAMTVVYGSVDTLEFALSHLESDDAEPPLMAYTDS